MDIIKRAITVLNNGGIIIYPTDTAFGMGCRIDRREAVDHFFSLRRRPLTQATPILVSSINMALTYFGQSSNIVRRLMKKYWPGALTIVAPCKKDLIYSPIRAASDTVGIRMPDHETALAIIAGVGVPIIGSSANFHGHATAYCQEDLDLKLIKLVSLVVPGICRVGQVSTVIDCTAAPWRIIRQGAIKLAEFEL